MGMAACLLLSASLLGACSKGEAESGVGKNAENVNETGMPIVKKPINVKAFGAKFFASQDWNDLMLWNEYEKMTDINIDWETIQIEGLTEKRNLLMTGGDYPEMFFASAFSKTDLLKYGQQGIFLPLNDLIDQYAPNFKKILEENPSIAAGVTLADGKIYGFPTIYDPNFAGLQAGTPWIKKDWLDNLGLEEPQTTDEFYEVLKAFKENDPNGNGEADEQAWGGLYGIDEYINFLRGSFGLNKQGTMNIYLDFEEGTENFRFVPATDGYKELLQYLNKLYSEGLIHKDVFTTTPQDFMAEASRKEYGVLNGIDPGELFKFTGYVGVPVLEGPNGDKEYTAVTNGLGNLGMFVLTDKAENPEAMVRWIDYFYGDEGTKMFFMGFEGVTYEEDANGDFKYLDTITDNPDGLNMDQAISEYLTWPGGYYPGIVKEEFFQGAESNEASTLNAEKAMPYTLSNDKVLPGLNYTVEQNDEVSAILTDIQTYVKEMNAAFITGKEDFSKWDEYKKTLEKMGVDRYLEIAQEAYETMK